MATFSKVFSSNSAYTLYLDVTESSYNVQNNTSVVAYTLRAVSTKALQYGSWEYGAANTQYNIVINGTSVASGYKTYDFRNYQTLTVASGTTTVTHNDDGTKVVACSASYCGGSSPIGSATASGNLTLTTIPRASEITCASPVAMASSQTVTVTQKSASFSHKLYYSTDGETFTQIGSGTATKNYTWTVPNTASSVPNAESTTYILKCETFTNSNYEGDPLESTLSITATVPASYVPTIAIGTITEGNNAVPNGFPFLVGVSTLVVPTTFTGSAGSTVVSRSVTANGETQTSTNSGSVTFNLTKALSALSTVVNASTTDSRGRTGTASQTVTAIAYSAPTVEIDCTRCQSDGTIDALGEYVLVRAKWSWTSIGSPELNSADIAIKVDGTLKTTYTTQTNSQTTYTQIAILPSMLATNQYTITAEISDEVMSASVSQVVTKATLPLSLFDDGNGIGVTIGRMATREGFNVTLDTTLLSGQNINLFDGNNQQIKTMTTDDLFNGGGGLAKFVKGTPIDLYDTDGETVLYSRNPENLVFYDGDSGEDVASNFIFVSPSANVSTPTSGTKYYPNLSVINGQKGNGFEVASNGDVQCNKNGTIRVTAFINMNGGNASVGKTAQLAKNRTEIQNTQNSAYGAWGQNMECQWVGSVVAGDTITFFVNPGNTNTTDSISLRSTLLCEYIEDYYITQAISESNTYSTDEIEVGRWIDNKPIYRKVIVIPMGYTASQETKTVSISALNIDSVVTLRGVEKSVGTTDYWRVVPMSYAYASASSVAENINLYINATTDTLYISSRGVSLTTAYVILEYTKTTD